MDLGTKQKKGETGLPSPMDDKAKITYPDLVLRDKKVEAFLKECPDSKELGYELSAMVNLRVSGLSEDEFGKRLNFEVLSIDDLEDTDEDEDEEKEDKDEKGAEKAEDKEPDEEKVLGYKRPKVTKPAPPMGAEDLEE